MKKIILIIITLFSVISIHGQEIEPTSRMEYYLKGVEHLKNKEYEKAIISFDNALKSNYVKSNENILDISDIYNWRGMSYLGLENTKEAMSSYNLAIANCNHNTSLNSVYKNRGFLKMYLEDFRGAILDFDKIIQSFEESIKKHGTVIAYQLGSQDWNLHAAFSDRGFCNMRLNNFEEAILDTNNAINIFKKKNADDYFTRGVCKMNIGQKNEGCIDLSKSGELGNQKAYQYIKEYCN